MCGAQVRRGAGGAGRRCGERAGRGAQVRGGRWAQVRGRTQGRGGAGHRCRGAGRTAREQLTAASRRRREGARAPPASGGARRGTACAALSYARRARAREQLRAELCGSSGNDPPSFAVASARPHWGPDGLGILARQPLRRDCRHLGGRASNPDPGVGQREKLRFCILVREGVHLGPRVYNVFSKTENLYLTLTWDSFQNRS